MIVPLGDFFGMGRLSVQDLAVIVGVVGVWILVVRAIWRFRLLDRLLGIPVTRGIFPEESAKSP